MAYTPPANTVVNFDLATDQSIDSLGAWTPPAFNAVNFDFAAGIPAFQANAFQGDLLAFQEAVIRYGVAGGIQEAPDTLSATATGAVSLNAALSVTEAADTLVSAATAKIAAALSKTEAADT